MSGQQTGTGAQRSQAAVADGGTDQSLIVRAVWFVFVGWWATGIWLSVAWLLNVTIIGLPIGIKMINLTPKVLTLKNRTAELSVDVDGTVVAGETEQRSLLVRGVYFVFVGWWASGIWMAIAYLLSLTIIGLPVAILMFNKLPFVVSLYRY